MNYLDWIDEQITKHQTEIARLTVARGVIEEASGVIRVNKVPKLLPKPAKHKGTFIKGKTRDLITAVLQNFAHGARVREITQTMRIAHPEVTVKAISNALYNGRRIGAFVREDGLYSLPQPKPEQAEAVA